MARRLDIAQCTRILIKRDTHTKDFPLYLASRLATTREHAESFIMAGGVRLNGVPATLHEMPMGGDVIEIDFPDSFTAHMQPRAMELDIIYRDDQIIAVNKPGGIVVHPARGHMCGFTILNGLMHLLQTESGESVLPYLAVSHRIDQNTSGIVLYARDTATHQFLARQFQERCAKKTYLAVIDGVPEWDELLIDAPIGRDPEREGLWCVANADDPKRKDAQTEVRVRARLDGVTLVEALPLTGRTHQIRLHLRHAGFPLCGDPEYHPCPEAFPLRRQALHAARLVVAHPMRETPLELVAPLPEDMQQLLAACGGAGCLAE